MPPFFALILCTLFVFSLLRLERQRSSEVSGAAWIPTLWLLLIAGKPLGVWFGTAGAAESGSPLDRLVLSTLLCIGVAALVKRQFAFAAALRANCWLLLLIGYMLLSTLWSEITFIALKRCVRETIVVIMAFVILSEADPRQALESVLRRSTYVLIPSSLLLIKY